MRYRLAVAFAAVLCTAIAAHAQKNNVYSKAVPPDKAALDRLNLRTEWSQVIPVEGTRDTLTQIQTFDDQLFVQTRTGAFIALDADHRPPSVRPRLGQRLLRQLVSVRGQFEVRLRRASHQALRLLPLHRANRIRRRTRFAADHGIGVRRPRRVLRSGDTSGAPARTASPCPTFRRQSPFRNRSRGIVDPARARPEALPLP